LSKPLYSQFTNSGNVPATSACYDLKKQLLFQHCSGFVWDRVHFPLSSCCVLDLVPEDVDVPSDVKLAPRKLLIFEAGGKGEAGEGQGAAIILKAVFSLSTFCSGFQFDFFFLHLLVHDVSSYFFTFLTHIKICALVHRMF